MQISVLAAAAGLAMVPAVLAAQTTTGGTGQPGAPTMTPPTGMPGTTGTTDGGMSGHDTGTMTQGGMNAPGDSTASHHRRHRSGTRSSTMPPATPDSSTSSPTGADPGTGTPR